MFNRQGIPSAPSLSRPIFYSAIFHVLFFILVGLSASVNWRFSDRPMDMIWVELPKGTSEDIGTGLKESEGLPKSTIQEQKEALKQPAEPPKEVMKEPEAKKNKKETPKPPPKKLSSQQQKMKDALAKINKQLKNRVIQPEAAQTGSKSEGYKYGTSDQPLRVPIDDPEYVKYQAQIRYKVVNEWVVPGKYTELPEGQRPKARIVVMINEEGEVVSTDWEQHSGDNSFDKSCIRAIYNASPFDKPAERLKWEAYNEGFLMEFDPRLKP